MTIFWCEEHKHRGLETVSVCLYAHFTGAKNCRMVEMVLAPKGSLVIEKVDGGWPETIIEFKGHSYAVAPSILDALLAAQEEE